ncbi:polysaccharide biosynthesis protein [Vibrio diazotrophicus]|uniref:polysaccharide biosynthesis protein n=1 Tax=Vibrio diazotrophicus TaxID=685 RepID=UPI003D2F9304
MIKILYLLGLTNLSKDQVNAFYFLSNNELSAPLDSTFNKIIWLHYFRIIYLVMIVMLSLTVGVLGIDRLIAQIPYNAISSVVIPVFLGFLAITLSQVLLRINIESIYTNRTIKNKNDIDMNELLDRDTHIARGDFVAQLEFIKGKVIMITGAGGNVGSALVKHLVKLEPEQIILFDNNEFLLYSINNSCERTVPKNIKLTPVLGDINDKDLLEDVMGLMTPDVIFHCAAYKHVPLAESNCFSVVRNNVFGTYNLVECTRKYGIKNVVLVSTDKSVRPTSIVGGTKRMSEIIFQLAADKEVTKGCNYTVARFGNIISQNGTIFSIIDEQIRNGRDVTLTHPDVVRYFLTEQEAVNLLVLSPLFNVNGKVVIFDMGLPIKVLDVAKKIAQLYGLELSSDNKSNEGDINVHFTGLRPGEKLYEELLIGDSILPTGHPKLLVGDDSDISYEKLEEVLNDIDEACYHKDELKLKKLLGVCIPLFTPPDGTNDHFSNAKKRLMTERHNVRDMIYRKKA